MITREIVTANFEQLDDAIGQLQEQLAVAARGLALLVTAADALRKCTQLTEQTLLAALDAKSGGRDDAGA